MVIDIISAEDFNRHVVEASYSLPVLVDFWADWCDPCHILMPILTELATEYDGHRWALAKVDTEALPKIAEEYNIRGIPALRLFRNGQITASFNGLMWKKDMWRWIEEAIT